MSPLAVDSTYTGRIDLSRYDRTPILFAAERQALAAWSGRYGIRPALRAAVPRLCQPLDDIRALASVKSHHDSYAATRVMLAVKQTGQPYWAWNDQQWLELMASVSGRGINTRPYIVAMAYLLGGFQSTHLIHHQLQLGNLASLIFGRDVFDQELTKLRDALDQIGYRTAHLRKELPARLAALMFENRNPHVETFDEALLERVRQKYDLYTHSVTMISCGLAALGVISHPISRPRATSWKERSYEGIHPDWAMVCRRWRETSTLTQRVRETNYSFILRLGLWLARVHPEITHPSQWTTETCADFLAAAAHLKVGDWCLASFDYKAYTRVGQPMNANSKRGLIYAVRRFFTDIEHWGWVTLSFNPHYHLATPNSILRLTGPNPRTIDDNIWLKLIWASLNLQPPDLVRQIPYPFEMVKAMSVVWTHAGLRQNEILRLHLGCARAQSDPIVNDDTQEALPAGTLCYLDVPAGKTCTAYTKPVNAAVKEAIEAWMAIRPEQPPLIDAKTGDRVRFLFQYRGRIPSVSIFNQTLIPLLCQKAGVPRVDSRGNITSHRARASVVTALASVPQGMSLIELMHWSGHRTPSSTMYYLRVKPTRLAGAFAKADQMAHMIEVLIDHEAVVSGAASKGEPYKYYDLGDSYCTNPFWSTCPHRMACAGCDFNVPKVSARGEALAAKAFLHRYLEEVPLTTEEQAVVEGDLKKLDTMLDKLKDVPTPDGRTPQQLNQARQRIEAESVD